MIFKNIAMQIMNQKMNRCDLNVYPNVYKNVCFNGYLNVIYVKVRDEMEKEVLKVIYMKNWKMKVNSNVNE